ncbi:MAG: polysaccharide deacetylase family protein [Chloroflexota bacterium]
MGARSRPRTSFTVLLVLFTVVAGISSLGTPHPTASGQVRAAEGEVQTIRKFDTSEPVIALTFDAGADRGYAEEILNTLQEKRVAATFGMTGIWAEANPDLIRRMHAEGHHLINHSWNHPSFPAITSAERRDQLERTDNLIYSQIGVHLTPYFRPPYGEYDDSVLADLAANGYIFNIMWTVDTLGWLGYSDSQILQRVLDGASPGAIMLMHVGAQSRDAFALPDMIDTLRARGYRFATVETLAGTPQPQSRYFPETGYTVSGAFLAYWNRLGDLPIFGYPLSDAFEENGRTVQYFERARFELHPENAGTPYEILLTRLGADMTEHRTGEAPFRPLQAGDDANCTFFPETGHRLCFGFRAYWESHGGLPVFGYPISEEFRERNPDTGQTYTVQYFERARFEWHPENAGTPYEVLLGRLGAQRYLASGRE